MLSLKVIKYDFHILHNCTNAILTNTFVVELQITINVNTLNLISYNFKQHKECFYTLKMSSALSEKETLSVLFFKKFMIALKIERNK